MGDSLCLQPWTSVTGNNRTIVQGEADWLDIGHVRDLVVYVELGWIQSQVSITTLDIQSSPSRDDVFFTGPVLNGGVPDPFVARFSFANSLTFGVQPLAISRFATGPAVPPSRWLRWAINFPSVTSGTNLTFRAWINANRGGY